MKIPRYTVKQVFRNRWAVINTATGIAHSFWDTRKDAATVAHDLNMPLLPRQIGIVYEQAA